MGISVRFPARKASDLGQHKQIVGSIVTDGVAALATTVNGNARVDGGAPSLTMPSTTLSAAAAVGATSVSLASTVGYATGSMIRISGAGQSGTSLGGSDLIAKISLAGSVATLFDPDTDLPITVQTAVAIGAVVLPGFLPGDYVSVAGGGDAGGTLVSVITSVNGGTGAVNISGRPGLPTTVAGAAMTRYYKIRTRQLARYVELRNKTTPQVDVWDETMDLGAGMRTAASGALSAVTLGMLVFPTYIAIPADMLPANSEFSLTIRS